MNPRYKRAWKIQLRVWGILFVLCLIGGVNAFVDNPTRFNEVIGIFFCVFLIVAFILGVVINVLFVEPRVGGRKDWGGRGDE